MGFLGVYRALYDYVPTAEGELAIDDGDLVFVLDRGEDGWWRAKKKAASEDEDEPEGLIPENYIEEAKSISAAKALYDYTRQTDEELSFAEDAALEVYDTTDPDWTLVGAKGEFGFAPANYIELTDAAPQTPKRPTQPVRHDAEEPGPLTPSSSPSPVNSPAAALAGIIQQRTGGGIGAATRRAISPPPHIQSAPRRVQFTPEESEDEAPPPMPRRPISEAISSPPRQTRFADSPREISRGSPRSPIESPGITAPPPTNHHVSRTMDDESAQQSPRGYHIYNIFEMIEVMGKNKKMPVTLGINIAKGVIMISGEKERSSKEWSADKLTHYSIEGKHVFMELVRPSKSIDFHAGAKDTAHEIVSALGDLAGMVRAEGLREVFAAANGTDGPKKGKMVYEFMAQGEDEVTVAEGDEVIILDDTKSDEWWMVRRLKNNKEGVVPSNYVEVIGPIQSESPSAASGLRSFIEQNRLDEEQASRAAAKKKKKDDLDPGNGLQLPKRNSSLMAERQSSHKDKRSSRDTKSEKKSMPDSSKVRTWTDRSGSFKVEAEFIGLRDEKIHLHKLNGVKIAVPVPKMSKEDLDYVEKATGKSLGDLRPVADIIKQNAALRSESSGAQIERSKKSEYDWFDFFLSSGVDPNICQRYASAFDRDQMGEEVLPDINPTVLRTLGLKEGDILRVMKFLDNKYGRKRVNFAESGDEGVNGGLFSGPGGTLKNNTAKGRPTPPIQTNSELNLESMAKGISSPAGKRANGSAGKSSDGFEDDAWAPRPQRSATTTPTPVPTVTSAASMSAPAPIQPTLTPGMQAMSLLDQPLIPTPAPQQQQPTQGATPGLFERLAKPGILPKQRPQGPQQNTGGDSLIAPPPNRSSSAPHTNQQSGFQPPPLQPQLTGYQGQPRMQTFAVPPGQSMLDVQQQQQLQRLQQQPTGFTAPLQQQSTGFPQQQNMGFNQFQQNGIMPQPTGYSMPFQQNQQTGFNQFQPSYQQALQNGQSQTNGSPFADPPRPPFQPQATGFGQQATGFQPQKTGFQPSFLSSSMQPQATGINSFLAPALQPQATGIPASQYGNYSNPSGYNIPPVPPIPQQQLSLQPLVPQKTGPPPPVRFGVGPAKRLVSQPTGRADLSKATPQNPFGFG